MKMKALVMGMAAALVSVSVVTANAQDIAPGRGLERREAQGLELPFGIDVRGRAPGAEHRPQRGPRGHRGGNPERELDRLDTNDDGVVDENEFVASRTDRVEDHFNRLDEDGDGLLGRDELEREPRPDRPEIDRQAVIECVRETIADYDPEDPLEERFDTIDTNDDGVIDLLELSTALQERAFILFDRLDTNGDGVLTLEEIEAGHEAALNLRRVIRACIDELTDPFDTDPSV